MSKKNKDKPKRSVSQSPSSSKKKGKSKSTGTSSEQAKTTSTASTAAKVSCYGSATLSKSVGYEEDTTSECEDDEVFLTGLDDKSYREMLDRIRENNEKNGNIWMIL